MSLPEQFTEIGLDQWLETATQHQAEGYRLVQMTGTARPEHFEVMVSYDKDLQCRNFRVFVPHERPELPSISGIFAGAFTYENELKDLFGFEIPGLTIDYGGNFLRTKVKIPFAGAVTANKEPPAKAKAKTGAQPAAAEPAPTATPER